MTDDPVSALGANRRTDRASRFIRATPKRVYQALTDPGQFAHWIAPEGARATIDRFEPEPDGALQITLTFDPRSGSAKTTANTDVVKGRFLTLDRGRCVKQAFEFESTDPAFAGTMTMTWRLALALGGTTVEVTAEDVPPGISAADHHAGMASSLANLAALFEQDDAA
ncbi:SRPBCC domain-containing protein [Sphingobium cloacae]|uniref:Activator of Hsp90 ATPase homologue 1/2-like C-terminal domain-containing protein n=1 Tax=Sphingobium cloacae TaxID=120107 RepID=A0A1E1F931_9SPHN|nr:SRPBCC domain-containing protein [Sphingobium cloacae]BAV67025.1 hypothetical protein SCLO_7000250 [Sphingobium cloacae]